MRSTTEDGWFFSGRYKALARLKCGVAAAPAGRILVIAGTAGSGKSAVLGRFVTLADLQQRDRAEEAGATADVPAAALPDRGSVDIAIWAAKRSVFSLAMEIATAAGSDLALDRDNPVDGLMDFLRRQNHDRVVVVIDALDEAEKPSEAALMLAELAKGVPGLRVVVGIRTGQSGSSVLSRLGAPVEEGGNIEIIDLSADEFWDHNDLEKFVRRYLMEQDGSPYANVGVDFLTKVAHAVAASATRSFLVASTTARALAHQAKIIAPNELENLPESAGEAFELDLKRFGTEWRQGIRVIGALAYGQGRGLPRALWPTVAGALVGTYNKSNVTRDVEYWKNAAEVYLIQESIGGEEVSRLYHQEFAQHLRTTLDTSTIACGDPACPHGAPSVCIATALHREVTEGAGSGQLSTHLLEHLAGYLKNGGLAEPLYQLVITSWWKEAKKSVFPDSVVLLDDIGKAIDLARREPPNIPRIIRLCGLSSRQVTPVSTLGGDEGAGGESVEAPPIVIDTLARVGQPKRARLMADNVLFSLDRCHAHALLAQRFYEQGVRDEALRCLAEARRSTSAVRGDLRAMAQFWVVRAAHSMGEIAIAQTAAMDAVSYLEEPSSVPPDGQPYDRDREELWGFWYSAFWAALGLRLIDNRAGLAQIKGRLKKQLRSPKVGQYAYCNLPLQLAAVVGHLTLLKSAARGGPGTGILRTGNLELALVEAGMVAEFERLERARPQRYLSSDSGKRFVWALARLGRFDEAVQNIPQIDRLEERARALYRISECAERRMNPHIAALLCGAADRLLCETCSDDEVESWRVKSWLAPVYCVSDQQDRAIELCDAVSALGLSASSENSLCLPVPKTYLLKAHVFLTLGPSPDEQAQRAIQEALDCGASLRAEEYLEDIKSKRARARAGIQIAERHADPKRALDLALDAMRDASVAGIGELRSVFAKSGTVLSRAIPDVNIAELEMEYRHALEEAQ